MDLAMKINNQLTQRNLYSYIPQHKQDLSTFPVIITQSNEEKVIKVQTSRSMVQSQVRQNQINLLKRKMNELDQKKNSPCDLDNISNKINLRPKTDQSQRSNCDLFNKYTQMEIKIETPRTLKRSSTIIYNSARTKKPTVLSPLIINNKFVNIKFGQTSSNIQ